MAEHHAVGGSFAHPSGESTKSNKASNAGKSGNAGNTGHSGNSRNSGNSGSGESKVAIFAALAANLGIAVTKFLAFALTGMSSMLAEGIHSVADSGNQLLLLAGGRSAKKDADAKHPFGYGPERYLAGFVVSIIVFSLGGLFSLFEAYEKWHEVSQPGAKQPSTHEQWWWVPLAVLLIAICMEGKALHTTVKEAREPKGEQSWIEFIKNAKSPDLPVLLCEDTAAVTGLIFAAIGVAASVIFENGIFDAIGAAMIGLLLICVAGFLFRETRSLLLGEAATEEAQDDFWEALEATDGIQRVIHMKTMHLGPQELLVAAKIAIGAGESGRDIALAIDAGEEALRKCRPGMQMIIYLEPDLDLGHQGDTLGHRSSAEHDDTQDELIND